MEKLIDSKMIPVVDVCRVAWVCSFSMHRIHRMQQARLVELLKAYEYINAHPDELLRRIMPNNWLKLHGYRMRRRVR